MAIREQLEMRSPIAVLFAVVIGSVAAFSASAQEIVPDVITSENAATLEGAVIERGGLSIAFHPLENQCALATYRSDLDLSRVVVMSDGSDTTEIVETGNTEYTVINFGPRDDVLAIGSELGDVFLYSTRTTNLVRVLKGHTSAILDLAFEPSGKLLVSTSSTFLNSDESSAIIWRVEDGMKYAIQVSGNAYAAAFHPLEDYMVIGVFDDSGSGLHFYQYNRNEDGGIETKLIRKLVFFDLIGDLAFTSDGRYLVVGVQHEASMWYLGDLATDAPVEVMSYPNPDWAYKQMAVSPNDEVIALSSDEIIHLYNLQTGEKIVDLEIPYGVVRDMAFSADGRYLAATSWDSSTTTIYSTIGWREDG
jgi:WD40 repeat protein